MMKTKAGLLLLLLALLLCYNTIRAKILLLDKLYAPI